jgi:hypothetical protein
VSRATVCFATCEISRFCEGLGVQENDIKLRFEQKRSGVDGNGV